MSVNVCLRSYCLAVKKPFQPQLTMADKEKYVEFEVHALEDGWIWLRMSVFPPNAQTRLVRLPIMLA